jgi:hypothetical protein
VRFYVRVDVFAGVRRFRAVWVNFYPKTWFSLSLVRLFATTTQKPTEEEKYKSEEEEEEYARITRRVMKKVEDRYIYIINKTIQR